MILRDRPASLTVTLLAGSERASRALVLNQLVDGSRSRRLAVLTFDPQSQSLAAKQPIPLRQAGIRIARSGLTVPSSAGLILELSAILRQRSADEVIVELTRGRLAGYTRHFSTTLFRRDQFGKHCPAHSFDHGGASQ